MSTPELKVYGIFKASQCEPEAAAVLEYIDKKTEKKYEKKKDILATKEDLTNLRVEMREIKADTINWMFIFWIGQLVAIITIIKMIK